MDDNLNLQPQGGETNTAQAIDVDSVLQNNDDAPKPSEEPAESAKKPDSPGATDGNAAGEATGEDKKRKADKKKKKEKVSSAPKQKKEKSKKSKRGKPASENDDPEKKEKSAGNPFHTARKKRNLIYILIAVAVFIATAAIQYTFTHLLVTPRSGELVNWMFVTGNSDAAVTSAGTYYQAEHNNRVSKPLTDLYFHAKHTAEASDEMRLLSVTGLFSPRNIFLDGKEIDNNGHE